jgi:hypothetical protein
MATGTRQYRLQVFHQADLEMESSDALPDTATTSHITITSHGPEGQLEEGRTDVADMRAGFMRYGVPLAALVIPRGRWSAGALSRTEEAACPSGHAPRFSAAVTDPAARPRAGRVNADRVPVLPIMQAESAMKSHLDPIPRRSRAHGRRHSATR